MTTPFQVEEDINLSRNRKREGWPPTFLLLFLKGAGELTTSMLAIFVKDGDGEEATSRLTFIPEGDAEKAVPFLG